MTADPLTGGEAEDEGFFDASWGSVVDVFQRGLKFEFGVLEETFETFVLFPDPLAIDQQGKAFLEREVPEGRLFKLFFKTLGHSDKLHGVKFVKGLFIEHRVRIPFIGNIVFPAGFHAPAEEGAVQMKRSDPKVVGPIHF